MEQLNAINVFTCTLGTLAGLALAGAVRFCIMAVQYWRRERRREQFIMAYIQAGLSYGFRLFLPPAIYPKAIKVMKKHGYTEEQLSRVHQTEFIEEDATHASAEN